MPSKEERERRKKLTREIEGAVRAAQEMWLPLSKQDLHDLFNWVDEKLEGEACGHTLRHALTFIRERGLSEDKVVNWLKEFGGYCDCEIMFNVEEEWGEFAGST